MGGDERDRASRIERDMGREAKVVTDDRAADRLERRIDGGGPATREADHADPPRVDCGMGGEQAERRERPGHIGRRRQSRLVGRGLGDPATGEVVDNKSSDAQVIQALRPLPGVLQDAAAAVNHDHGRNLGFGRTDRICGFGQSQHPGDHRLFGHPPQDEIARAFGRQGFERNSTSPSVGERRDWRIVRRDRARMRSASGRDRDQKGKNK